MKKNQLIMQRRIVSSGMVMRLNDATYGQVLSKVAFFLDAPDYAYYFFESFILNK